MGRASGLELRPHEIPSILACLLVSSFFQGFKYAFLSPKIKQGQTEPLPNVFSYGIPLIHAELFSKFVLFP